MSNTASQPILDHKWELVALGPYPKTPTLAVLRVAKGTEHETTRKLPVFMWAIRKNVQTVGVTKVVGLVWQDGELVAADSLPGYERLQELETK